MSATDLHALIAAVAPIHGVAGPYDQADKDRLPWPAATLFVAADGSLWRVDFQDGTTADQINAARNAVTGFAPPDGRSSGL